MAKGGARPGAGRKKGGVASHTLEAQAKKQRIVSRVNDATDVLLNSQISLARGLSLLYKIIKDQKGKKEKPELVTSSYEIEAYLRGDYDSSDDYYYITTEKPNNMAIDSLFDRVHGKSTQAISGPDGGAIQLEGVNISIRK